MIKTVNTKLIEKFNLTDNEYEEDNIKRNTKINFLNTQKMIP